GENPGGEEPGDGETEPALPEGTPTFSGTSVEFEFLNGRLVTTHYAIAVSGTAGPTLGASPGGGTDSSVLTPTADDPTLGYGSIDLRPTLSELCSDATVEFFYTTETETGSASSATLSQLWDIRDLPLFDVACLLADEAPADEAAATVPEATPASPVDTAPVDEAPVDEARTEEAPVDAAPAPVEQPAEAPVESPAPVTAVPTETTAPEDRAAVDAPAAPVDEGVPAL
ncbi:hypothetical protein J7E68_17695, partial [Microbacterium sp. ISL-103]|nr:hypothetical protein [Microbacterium sp. ISL-103]